MNITTYVTLETISIQFNAMERQLDEKKTLENLRATIKRDVETKWAVLLGDPTFKLGKNETERDMQKRNEYAYEYTGLDEIQEKLDAINHRIVLIGNEIDHIKCMISYFRTGEL